MLHKFALVCLILFAWTGVAAAQQPPGSVGLNRLWSQAQGDHFYTTSSSDSASAQSQGYLWERIEAWVYPSNAAGRTPLYRTYCPVSRDHFYTIDYATYRSVVSQGCYDEGIAAYVMASAVAGTVPLYRMWCAAAQDHFYAASENDRTVAGANGCVYERVEGYVYPVNHATFVAKSNPTTMTAGGSYAVSLTMSNRGSTTWTAATQYKLGATNPYDNWTWGLARVVVPANVPPGGNVTFNFTVKAPAAAGTYNFQWRMLREGVEWFGGLSTNATIQVGGIKKNVVYIHGRSMTDWPLAGRLFHDSTWIDKYLYFDGSKRLTDSGVRQIVRDALTTNCRSPNQCVIACYSAGCARMLYALDEMRALGTPANGVLWIEAPASAAGGSELAEISTRGGLRLLCKIFFTECGDPASPIDQDLTRQNMRVTLAGIQSAAPAPMYHLAGKSNICIETQASWVVTGAFSVVGSLVGGPIGVVISFASRIFFAAKTFKLCGNRQFPGGYGDGVVPVHSAAGYTDTGAHGSHNDGSPKYVFRAYEQVALFDADHRSIFGPYSYLGGLRMAVPGNASCPKHPLGTVADPDASIVYDDADGAAVRQDSPMNLLQICGESVWDGQSTHYSTCSGGCCSNFSTYNTGGCSCGELLCVASGAGMLSWFTGDNCSGAEYSAPYLDGDGHGDVWMSQNATWDGLGKVGSTITTVLVRSGRTRDGVCRRVTAMNLLDARCYYNLTISGQRVWRTNMDTANYLPDPNGAVGTCVDQWTHGIGGLDFMSSVYCDVGRYLEYNGCVNPGTY